MTDEEFVQQLQALLHYAKGRADEAFKAGDRQDFDMWDSRALHLQAARTGWPADTSAQSVDIRERADRAI